MGDKERIVKPEENLVWSGVEIVGNLWSPQKEKNMHP